MIALFHVTHLLVSGLCREFVDTSISLIEIVNLCVQTAESNCLSS